MDLEKIERREESEKKFHDKKYSKEKKINYYDRGFTSIIFDDMVNGLGNIEGKKILEFGCGAGWLTKILASKGAEVWAIDISDEAVNKAKEYIRSQNLQDRVHVNQMAAEKLKFDENTFDFVVGKAILHHLDLTVCIGEIKRVLKEHGRAVFMEPLGHNPLLNLYRRLTPNLRSKDETPMRFEQYSIIKKSFSKFKHEEYYLTTFFALIWYFFRMNNLMLRSRDILFKLDKIISNAFPAIRKYYWYSILMLEK